MLTVGEFCNREVVVATGLERVVDIARRMREEHVGCVVVVEERAGKRLPIGMITDRDIVVGLVAVEPSHLERALAQDLLSGEVYSAREDEDLYDVMTRMRGYGVRRVPVVDKDGALQGIVAFDDLLDHFAVELNRLSLVLERERDLERRHRPSPNRKD